MNEILVGDWTAHIEPANVRDVVARALRSAAVDTRSVSITVMRAARLLTGTDYAVVLSNGEHVAALSDGHPAYFKELNERTYQVAMRPADDHPWRPLPERTLLDLDYCGPTWMPLATPQEGSESS